MIDVRPFEGLGAFRNEWLDARHHFSFAAYHDPARMGFGALRVWNDDAIAPGTGFDPHPHREMEIITYVREGAITHRDSLGNEGRTTAGDIQVMHAGTGIVHAEYNRETTPTRLFQIWIRPDQARAAPGWATRRFPRSGVAVLADGREGRDESALPLYADASFAAGTLGIGETHIMTPGAGRVVYLVASRGTLTVNGIAAPERAGIAISDEERVEIAATSAAELVYVNVRA
ncbi:MAG: pirin family protein [Rhodospirillales bacterium]|nr:pirin family protein [Rhodospirillales bacterium]